jgi:hypothetical protein
MLYFLLSFYIPLDFVTCEVIWKMKVVKTNNKIKDYQKTKYKYLVIEKNQFNLDYKIIRKKYFQHFRIRRENLMQ